MNMITISMTFLMSAHLTLSEKKLQKLPFQKLLKVQTLAYFFVVFDTLA